MSDKGELMTADQAIARAWDEFDARRLPQAESIFRQVLANLPTFAPALEGLGRIAHMLRHHEAAVELFRQAVAAAPAAGRFHHSLGAGLMTLGKYQEAAASYRRAIELSDIPAWHSSLGSALLYLGQAEAAAAEHRRFIELEPNNSLGHNNLGGTLQVLGRVDEAIDAFREAMRLDPLQLNAHSNLLYSMHFTSRFSPAEILQEHRSWAARYTAAIPATPPRANLKPADRPLRIGFLSSDLMDHPVGRFMLPLLAAHDRHKFKIVCFSDGQWFDSISAMLKNSASSWHETNHLSNDELDVLIRSNKIDILVDLFGHTGPSRLLAFARKPAPIQASYLGYPDTSGLDTIDYRITDNWADPPGQTESFHTEKLIRLPRCFICYAPPIDAPDVSPLPARENGFVTFGSFNNFAKVSPEIAGLWAQILDGVPGSKLAIKSRYFEDQPTRDAALRLLAGYGLPEERIIILARQREPRDHFSAYGGIDIALDTFPYHGTTTTCEGLWMGAAVVTLAGQAHCSRVGASLLNAVGLGDLVAATVEQYVQIAVDLARDLPRLAGLRAGMRERLKASPLLDAQAHARDMEEAFRQMWKSRF